MHVVRANALQCVAVCCSVLQFVESEGVEMMHMMYMKECTGVQRSANEES